MEKQMNALGIKELLIKKCRRSIFTKCPGTGL
jgi:hypothetical protein